jgi:Ca2+-binding EF-hand superfamily protein
MFTKFQERKINHFFNVLDPDGAGALTLPTIVAIGDRYARIRGYAPTSPEGKRLRAALENWWKVVLSPMDTDGDQRITREELTQRMAAALPNAKGADAFRVAADAFFKFADANGDGRLVKDEYVDMFAVGCGLARRDVTQAFQRLDLQGRGYLDPDEWRNLVEEFFTSTDADAPGNWLYGTY